MPLQSSDLKIAKQANLTFEALLNVLKIQMDHAADLALPQLYAEEVMHLMAEIAKFALGSGMKHSVQPQKCTIPVDWCEEAVLNCKFCLVIRVCHICRTVFAAANRLHNVRFFARDLASLIVGCCGFALSFSVNLPWR